MQKYYGMIVCVTALSSFWCAAHESTSTGHQKLTTPAPPSRVNKHRAKVRVTENSNFVFLFIFSLSWFHITISRLHITHRGKTSLFYLNFSHHRVVVVVVGIFGASPLLSKLKGFGLKSLVLRRIFIFIFFVFFLVFPIFTKLQTNIMRLLLEFWVF